MNEIIEYLGRIEKQNGEILFRLNQLEGKSTEKLWWSPEELATILKRKPFTVREWCRLGRIQANKEEYSRLWRVPASEAQRLLGGGLPQPKVSV